MSAARRAVKAGYTDVSVMADGIMGWDAAGQPHDDRGVVSTRSDVNVAASALR